MRKRYILLVLIIIIGIISLLFYNNHINTNKNSIQLAEEQSDYLEGVNNPGYVTKGMKPSINRVTNLYFTVDNCIKNYISFVVNENYNVLINILNEEYVNKNNINNENISKKLQKYEGNSFYRTYEEYNLTGVSFSSYYVKGKIGDEFVYFELGLDISNNTYDIKPISSDEYLKLIDTVSNPTNSQEKTIAKKKNNTIPFKKYDEDEIGIVYLCDYFYLMLTDPKQSYDMLNEEYKKAKFKNINSFNDYINNNRDKIELMYKLGTMDSNDFESFDQYYNFKQKNKKYKPGIFLINKENDEYTQYVCTNESDDYYIFNVRNPGNYEVLLDNTTVET